MKIPNTVMNGFGYALVLMGLLACTSALADPGTDYVSRVEAYLDRIQIKVDAIQQSVDGIEDPPLAEKVTDAFELETCVSLEAAIGLGLAGKLEIPAKAEAKGNPGAAIFQALIKLHAKLSGSAEISGGGNLGAGYSICFNLWKIGKALKEEINSQAAVQGIEPRAVELSSGPLGDLSLHSQAYLIALSNASPTEFYNVLLTPEVNEVFGFNPDRITTIAYALDDELHGIQSIPNPETMFTDVEASLNRFAGILPFSEAIDIGSLLDGPEKLNPCSYMDDIPFGSSVDCSELQTGLVDGVGWVVGVISNLTKLIDIENALIAAKGFLETVWNSTLGEIQDLITPLEEQIETICEDLGDVVDCQ